MYGTEESVGDSEEIVLFAAEALISDGPADELVKAGAGDVHDAGGIKLSPGSVDKPLSQVKSFHVPRACRRQ